MRFLGRRRGASPSSPTDEGTPAGRGRLPRKRTRVFSVFVVFGALAAFTRPGKFVSRGLARWLDSRVEGFAEPESSAYGHFFAPVLARLYRRVAEDVATELKSRGRDRNATIVDVGCGTGELVAAMSRRMRDARIVGLDSSPSMLLWANRHSTTDGRVNFMTGDAALMPFPDESVDLVVSTLSLHHWQEPADAFAEIARVLQRGGVALVYDAGLLTQTDKEMAEVALNAGLEPSEIVRESVRGGLLSRAFVRFRLEGLPEE